MKKRVLTAVLAAALVTGTCAATVSAKEEKTYTIGICQLVQHDALDAATKGFEDAITEKMGDSVKLTSKMHRVIPIPVLRLSTALFLKELT